MDNAVYNYVMTMTIKTYTYVHKMVNVCWDLRMECIDWYTDLEIGRINFKNQF